MKKHSGSAGFGKQKREGGREGGMIPKSSLMTFDGLVCGKREVQSLGARVTSSQTVKPSAPRPPAESECQRSHWGVAQGGRQEGREGGKASNIFGILHHSSLIGPPSLPQTHLYATDRILTVASERSAVTV